MLKAYLRFSLYYGLSPLPASQSTILRYTAFLARSLNPTSISNYLNVVRLLHVDAGFDSPLSDWSLTMLKRGIMRMKGKPVSQKLPITPQILLMIRNQISLSTPFNVAFWAACVTAFFTFLRKSTLLPASVKCVLPEKQLCISDVVWGSDNVLLTIRHSKTIQFGQRILQIPLCKMDLSPLCPVRALHDLHALQSDISLDRHLFSFWDKNQVNCVTHDTFVTALRHTLAACGFRPQDFSGHSFRRGGCSFALSLGMPQVLIKLHGDWKSNAFERYISIEKDLHCKFAKALVVGASMCQ